MDEHWDTLIVLVQKHGQVFEQLSSRLCVAHVLASTRPRTRLSDVTMVWETTMFVVLLLTIEGPGRSTQPVYFCSRRPRMGSSHAEARRRKLRRSWRKRDKSVVRPARIVENRSPLRRSSTSGHHWIQFVHRTSLLTTWHFTRFLTSQILPSSASIDDNVNASCACIMSVSYVNPRNQCVLIPRSY